MPQTTVKQTTMDSNVRRLFKSELKEVIAIQQKIQDAIQSIENSRKRCNGCDVDSFADTFLKNPLQ